MQLMQLMQQLQLMQPTLSGKGCPRLAFDASRMAQRRIVTRTPLRPPFGEGIATY